MQQSIWFSNVGTWKDYGDVYLYLHKFLLSEKVFPMHCVEKLRVFVINLHFLGFKLVATLDVSLPVMSDCILNCKMTCHTALV